MRNLVVWVVGAMILVSARPALADESSDLVEMIQGLKNQMTQMQSTIEKQNARIQELETKSVSEKIEPTTVSQAQASPTASTAMSDNDFQKSLKDNIGEVIPWMKGAKFAGDFRLRHEYFDFYDFTPDAGTTQDRSRNRIRMRLRWGFEKDYGDDWKVAFRLATGSTTDQVSTNQTLGNPGYFNFKTFNIEKAMASYTPNGLKDFGAIKGVKIAAGKTDNPFLRYSTPIVWDADVTPEGVYEQANLQFISTEENKLNSTVTLGQFMINENSGIEADSNLWAYQGALNLSTYNFGTDMPVDISGAVSYYQYDNWVQTVLAANNTAATSYLRTNSIFADNFRVLDLYPEVQFYIGRNPVTLWYNHVENLGNVGTENIQAGGNDIHDADTAWGLGFKYGRVKNKGEWEASYGYYEIGANAVVAAFNDSDFGGPGAVGHTNRRGHKFTFGYGLTKDITLNGAAFLVQPLNPFSGSATTGIQNSTNENVLRTQLDLNYKF